MSTTMFGTSYWIFLLGCITEANRAMATRQKSLHNEHLKMGGVAWPPMFIVKKGRIGKVSYSGVWWDFIRYIQEARNCTITVVSPADGLWGNCLGKNNCSGMIEQVNKKKVDFALGMALPVKI